MRRSETLNEQLQSALDSRVIIEQAKGKLAERLGVDMNRAFSLLRDFARSRNLRLSDVARAFVDGTEPLTGLTASRPQQPLPGISQVPRQSRPGSWRTPSTPPGIALPRPRATGSPRLPA